MRKVKSDTFRYVANGNVNFFGKDTRLLTLVDPIKYSINNFIP